MLAMQDFEVPDIPIEDLVAAWHFVAGVWTALANDDGPAAAAAYYPPSLALQFPDGPPPNVATALRERLGLTRQECHRIGVATGARILLDGSGGDAVAIVGVHNQDRVGLMEPGVVPATTLVAYRLRRSDPWRLWGSIDELASDARFVDISGYLITGGPASDRPN
jgi:hypothetical protein